MTDNEIIKALECCKSVIGGNCDACPYVCCNMYEESDAIKDAISLINRQKAEIERLNKANASVVEHLKKSRRQLKTAKAESIKEFASALKERCYLLWSAQKVEKIVDSLVKEMVGETE